MKPILLFGSFLVTLALIFYSIGAFTERKKKIINHGFIGYSALLAMLIDNILLWNLQLTKGKNKNVPVALHRYSQVAYACWVLVYISGFLVAMNK